MIITDRKKILNDLYNVIEDKFQEYKEKVVNNEEDDYCEEMALMYDFKKFIQYLQHENMITDEELKTMYEFGLKEFVEEFMETFWNNQLGNSYEDITKLIRETINNI